MRIGVDLGGTKIEAIVIDENGNELWRRRVATPVENYDEILAQLYQLAHSNGDFQGVPARKRESDQRRPIVNRL